MYALLSYSSNLVANLYDYMWPKKEKSDVEERTSAAYLTYSRNLLPASVKMQKQLIHALSNPSSQRKSTTTRFTIQPPEQGFSVSEKPYHFLQSAVSQHQGGRDYQEDGYLEPIGISIEQRGNPKRSGTFFGVFDGHGDLGEVSTHLRAFLKPELEKLLKNTLILDDRAIGNVFVKLFHTLSQSYRETTNRSGATVTCAFRLGNTIYFPNIGDSRIILVTPNTEYQLTEDAIVENPRFQTWHKKKGHTFIHFDSALRIQIPNFSLYPMYARDVSRYEWMCCRPKITKIHLGNGKSEPEKGILYAKKGDFLILASDGLYEPALLTEVASEVRKLTQKQVPLSEIATQLVHTAGSDPGNDNVTAMIVAL